MSPAPYLCPLPNLLSAPWWLEDLQKAARYLDLTREQRCSQGTLAHPQVSVLVLHSPPLIFFVHILLHLRHWLAHYVRRPKHQLGARGFRGRTARALGQGREGTQVAQERRDPMEIVWILVLLTVRPVDLVATEHGMQQYVVEALCLILGR